MSVEPPVYGDGLLRGGEEAMGGVTPPVWTEQELTVLGEVVRDSLRKTVRRAIDAYVRGGVPRYHAGAEVLTQVEEVEAELRGRRL